MARRDLAILPSLLTFACAVVACTFSLLGITSKEWAVRNSYGDLTVQNWVNATATIYRSPFIICGLITPATATSPEEVSNTTLCLHFKPYGFNRTSCELAIATQDTTAGNIGDARLCQQIHHAGSFGIASSALVTAALVLTCVMFLDSVFKVYGGSHVESQYQSQEQDPSTEMDAVVLDETAKQSTGRVAKTSANTNQQHQKKHSGRHRGKRNSIMAHINLLLVACFIAGAITAVISQLYGILGFVQSLPNNSDFSSSSYPTTYTDGNHGPWIQGQALSVYMTCAWGFMLGAGTIASRAWILPVWSRGLAHIH